MIPIDKKSEDSWVTPKWIDGDQELNPEPKPMYRNFDKSYDKVYLEEEEAMYVMHG